MNIIEDQLNPVRIHNIKLLHWKVVVVHIIALTTVMPVNTKERRALKMCYNNWIKLAVWFQNSNSNTKSEQGPANIFDKTKHSSTRMDRLVGKNSKC